MADFYCLPKKNRPGVWRYEDRISRIIDPGKGVREFEDNLRIAKAGKMDVRLIVAHVDDPHDWEKIRRSDPACKIKKSFTCEPNRFGKVIEIPDDPEELHIIEFTKT